MTAGDALNLSVDEVLTTTRSVRKRLDLEKPVPREVLMECLELALQAPTGSNTRGWQWVFVEAPCAKRRWLVEIAQRLRGSMLRYRDGAKVLAGTYVSDEKVWRIVELALAKLADAGFAMRDA